jgi:lactoylglutathione lyase
MQNSKTGSARRHGGHWRKTLDGRLFRFAIAHRAIARLALVRLALARSALARSALACFCFGAAGTALAQLPAPNAAGVTTGHVHLRVPNPAKHREIWTLLGGEASGNMIRFPGMYVLFAEGEPSAPSSATSTNHLGFAIKDYAAYKAKLEAVNATIAYDNAEGGQIIADLPDGVRVEFMTVEGQQEPIVFHHLHVVGEDVEALRDWYADVLGAEKGERRNLPSAIVPGGRVDVLNFRDERPVGTRGTAIDHIGFDVADMDAFAARIQKLGVTFDVEPRRVDAIGLTIAFITDPMGTYIEITQGLAGR